MGDWVALLPARMRGEEGQPLRLAAAAVLLLLLGIFGWAFSRYRSNLRSGQPVHAASAQTVPAVLAASASTDPTKSDPLAPTTAGKTASTISLTLVPKSNSDVMARDVVQRAARSTVTERDPVPIRAVGTLKPAEPGTIAEAEVVPPDPAEALSSMKGGAAAVPSAIANPQPIFPFVAVPVSQGVTGGRLTHKVDPTYPTEARVQRVEGAVKLDALVGEDGNVHQVTVTSGPPLLANAAAQAVKRWRYEPFQLNGKPVSMHNQITIQFRLP
jgi:protein TonB